MNCKLATMENNVLLDIIIDLISLSLVVLKSLQNLNCNSTLTEYFNMTLLLRSLLFQSRGTSNPLKCLGPMRKSKYDASLWREKASSKRGNKHYNKGSGSRNEGVHTNRGQFKIIKERLLNLIVPDISNFQV